MREMLVDGLVGIAKGENPRLIVGRLKGYVYRHFPWEKKNAELCITGRTRRRRLGRMVWLQV